MDLCHLIAQQDSQSLKLLILKCSWKMTKVLYFTNINSGNFPVGQLGMPRPFGNYPKTY